MVYINSDGRNHHDFERLCFHHAPREIVLDCPNLSLLLLSSKFRSMNPRHPLHGMVTRLGLVLYVEYLPAIRKIQPDWGIYSLLIDICTIYQKTILLARVTLSKDHTNLKINKSRIWSVDINIQTSLVFSSELNLLNNIHRDYCLIHSFS